jgi:hypothetical protein
MGYHTLHIGLIQPTLSPSARVYFDTVALIINPHRETSIYFGFSEIYLDGSVEAAIDRIHPVPAGGAYRDRHGRWVRDAMDAAARETRRAGADGEAVWS